MQPMGDLCRRSVFPAALLWFAFAATFILAVKPCVAQPARFDSDLRAFLTRELPFSSDELARAERGEGIVTMLTGPAEKELGVAGLTWVDGDVSKLLEQQRAMSEHLGTKSMPEAGLFRVPARLDDLHSLHLDPADLKALGECRDESCAVKLFREDLGALAALSETHRRNRAVVASHYRQMLIRIVAGYQARGNAVMGTYADSDPALDAASEFETLLANSRYLRAAAPALDRYLRAFPVGQNSGSEDIFYWSKVAFGLKPTVRLNHMTVHRNAHHSRIPWVIASKQIYAAHYLQAGLELRFVLTPGATSGRSGYYLLTVNRSRIDGMEGFWRGILRTIVKSKTRDGMARYLAFAQERFGRSASPLEAQVQRLPAGANGLVSP